MKIAINQVSGGRVRVLRLGEMLLECCLFAFRNIPYMSSSRNVRLEREEKSYTPPPLSDPSSQASLREVKLIRWFPPKIGWYNRLITTFECGWMEYENWADVLDTLWLVPVVLLSLARKRLFILLGFYPNTVLRRGNDSGVYTCTGIIKFKKLKLYDPVS